MYCFISKDIVFEQYTVMNEEPVYFSLCRKGVTGQYLFCLHTVRHKAC